MSDSTADRWHDDRTTFQRVYDVIVGTHDYQAATDVAEQATCSETGAREALEQLVEMGIAERRDGRPAGYRRNDSYFTWKRVERLAQEHSPADLRSRVESLIKEDDAYQEQFGVPDPDTVSIEDIPVDDPAAHEARWETLREWRTVRQDIRVLRRAVERADRRVGDGAQA